MCSLGKA